MPCCDYPYEHTHPIAICACGEPITEEDQKKMEEEFEREFMKEKITKKVGRALKALSKR